MGLQRLLKEPPRASPEAAHQRSGLWLREASPTRRLVLLRKEFDNPKKKFKRQNRVSGRTKFPDPEDFGQCKKQKQNLTHIV